MVKKIDYKKVTILKYLVAVKSLTLENGCWRGYRPRLCVKLVAIKIIRAYPPNNK